MFKFKRCKRFPIILYKNSKRSFLLKVFPNPIELCLNLSILILKYLFTIIFLCKEVNQRIKDRMSTAFHKK